MPKHRTGQPAPITATPKTRRKGGYFNAAESVRAMARALVGRGVTIDAENSAESRQRKSSAKTWTAAELMQVVRRESLPIRGPHNMPAAELFEAVNAALTSSGRAALSGSTAEFTKPTEAPNREWSSRL